MSAVLEIVHLDTSEAFRQDNSIIDTSLSYVAASPGALGVYYGTLEEDPNVAYIAVVWAKIEDHHALINDAEVYPKLTGEIAKLVTGPINIHHVNLQPVDAIATVLNAPVTAITHITELKPDAKPETVFEHLASLNTAAKSAGLAGFHAGTYGKVVENDELRTITGWDAINDHRASRERNAEVAAGTAKLGEFVAGYKTVHIQLKPYRKYEA
ncbi:hypothetical protein BDW22DRAFT_334940 [Trametopsis cervina]|nr:hypothetical protein BDW22DRAFT_334940 [Trametopsis cervina]